MRVDTLLRICNVLRITPDEVLTKVPAPIISQEELFEQLNACSPQDRKTALAILSIFLRSIK